MNQKSSEENYTANTRAWKSSAASTSQYQHPLSSQEVAKVARQLFFKEEKTETPPEEPSFGSSEEKNRLSNKTHESSHRGSITSLGRDFVSAGSFRTSPDKEEADHYSNSSNPRNQDLKVNPNQFRNVEQNPQYYQNNANNTFTSQDPDSPFAPQKSQTTNYQDYPNSNNQMNGQRNFPFSHQQTSSFQQQQQQQQSEYNQYQNRPVNTQSYHGMPNNNYPVAHSYNPSIHNYSIHGTIPADLNASYMSSVSQTSKKRVKPIVVMNINIGNGKKEEINIFEGDNPFEVAYTFCMRYNLPGNLQQVLAQNIQTNVNNYYATRTQKKIPNTEPQDLRQIVTQQSQHQHHQSLVQPQTYQNYSYPADIDPRMSERASLHQPQPHEYSPKPTLEETMSHRSTVNEADVRSSPKNANQMKKQYQQYEQEEHHHQDLDENNALTIEEIEAQIKQLEKQRATYLNKPGTGKFAQQELRSGTFVSSTTGNNVNSAPKQAAQNKNKLFLNNVDAPAQETFGSYISQSTKHAGEKPNIHDRLYEEAKHRRAGSKSPARGGTGGTSYSYTKVGKEPVTSTSYGKIHQEKKAAANQRPEPRVQDTADKSPKSFRATTSKSPVNRPVTPTRQTERESSNTVKPAPVNKPTPVNDKKESIKNVSIAPETNKVVYSEPGNGQYVVAQPRSTNSNAENYRTSQKEAAPPRQSTVDRNELTRKVLEEIFRSLDDDFDGKISYENVYTKGLGPNIIESLSEVFMALEGGLELNFLDFTNIVNKKRLLDAINNVYEFDYAPEQETSSKTKLADSNTPRNQRSVKQEEERQFYSPKESIGSKDSPSTAYTAYEDEKPRNPKSILKQPSFEGPEDTTPITSKYKQIAAKHFANKK